MRTIVGASVVAEVSSARLPLQRKCRENDKKHSFFVLKGVLLEGLRMP